MQPSKRQAPLQRQRMQGLIIDSGSDSIFLSPCPQHVHNMCKHPRASGGEYLVARTCPPSRQKMQLPHREAVRQGGLSSTQVDLRPYQLLLTSLDKPTRSALWALHDIIQHCQLMHIPQIHLPPDYSVISTDAYFVLGDRIVRPGDEDLPDTIPDVRILENGWGAICFLHGNPIKSRGVPPVLH